MLRVAIPNKGSLAEESIAILKEAGYRQRSDSRDLVLVDTENQVELLNLLVDHDLLYPLLVRLNQHTKRYRAGVNSRTQLDSRYRLVKNGA